MNNKPFYYLLTFLFIGFMFAMISIIISIPNFTEECKDGVVWRINLTNNTQRVIVDPDGFNKVKVRRCDFE